MRGIRLEFDDNGPSFDFSKPLFDFETTVQNALVNIGTARGSDPIYGDDRGTDLLLDAVSGRMVNNAWANHAANFAAVSTLVFSQRVDPAGDPHGLREFRLKNAKITGQKLELSAQAVAADGEIRGVIAEL